jgi:hypothetical protein
MISWQHCVHAPSIPSILDQQNLPAHPERFGRSESDSVCGDIGSVIGNAALKPIAKIIITDHDPGKNGFNLCYLRICILRPPVSAHKN